MDGMDGMRVEGRQDDRMDGMRVEGRQDDGMDGMDGMQGGEQTG